MSSSVQAPLRTKMAMATPLQKTTGKVFPAIVGGRDSETSWPTHRLDTEIGKRAACLGLAAPRMRRGVKQKMVGDRLFIAGRPKHPSRTQ